MSAKNERVDLLWCECENCTHRWDEPPDNALPTIRCPECSSKNVNVEEYVRDA